MLLQVFRVYNTLFNHIEEQQDNLANKTRLWKKQLRNALTAAHGKLRHYYAKTYGFQGVIYVIGTILDPCQKLSVFQGTSWLEPEENDTEIPWVVKYENVFKKVYSHYRGRFPPTEEATEPSVQLDPIEKAIHDSKRRRYNKQFSPNSNEPDSHQYAELQKYLTER